ncbi:TIGR01548 family HAD-type hydrolase [Phormidium sp. CLA17]|uniref:TIGR01548 family HAD-type hydrolase n=1 Tax=Leptolyngbya sp. Cla-17 TaxID=2803751 RepID=UPI001492F63A|nr:TIGR01548 family HAD-type hydrolase [Leptolyngbya sp. Cla-17]MBM0740893.1 TIGR01548 family HAD-type hydrolase [Leptolyngbya sp. Cla-17]
MTIQSVNQLLALVIFDIDGVIRDVGGSYRRALADTVEHLTAGNYRPSQEDIDGLKAEGVWNNDWEASQELVFRYFEAQGGEWLPTIAQMHAQMQDRIWGDEWGRGGVAIAYDELVAFFQSRYRGTDPDRFTGYICQEPLLVEREYFDQLTAAQIGWGFFSGATRQSASYVLERRLGLQAPVLVAMEDAPGKPNPTGLFAAVSQLEAVDSKSPVLYVGDTVADMYTVVNARQQQGDRHWIAVGILPPHVQETESSSQQYSTTLKQAGADAVLSNVQELTPDAIAQLVQSRK